MSIYVWKNELCFICAGTVFVERNFTGIILHIVPIARTNMVCTGNENTLSQCGYSGVDGNPDCDHSYDIIVDCIGKSYY